MSSQRIICSCILVKLFFDIVRGKNNLVLHSLANHVDKPVWFQEMWNAVVYKHAVLVLVANHLVLVQWQYFGSHDIHLSLVSPLSHNYVKPVFPWLWLLAIVTTSLGFRGRPRKTCNIQETLLNCWKVVRSCKFCSCNSCCLTTPQTAHSYAGHAPEVSKCKLLRYPCCR